MYLCRVPNVTSDPVSASVACSHAAIGTPTFDLSSLAFYNGSKQFLFGIGDNNDLGDPWRLYLRSSSENSSRSHTSFPFFHQCSLLRVSEDSHINGSSSVVSYARPIPRRA